MSFDVSGIDAYKFALMNQLADAAFVVAKPIIPSRTLSAALTKQVDIRGRKILRASLFIPHFWAVMVHDGHGAFGPRSARFLVYFHDEADDPRKPTPERAADVRRLTKGEFREGLAENKRLFNTNPGGGAYQHMVVVKDPTGRPGHVGPVVAKPFFLEGMKPFEARVDQIIRTSFDAFVRANVTGGTLKATFGI